MKERKSFIMGNPSMSFISDETIASVDSQAEEKAAAAAPAESKAADKEPAKEAGKVPGRRYKKNPRKFETKSKRVQLLLQPGAYEPIKQIADEKGASFNALIDEIIYKFAFMDADEIRERIEPEEGDYIETKSRRTQILIEPTMHEMFKEKANALGESFNELANIVLKIYARDYEKERK